MHVKPDNTVDSFLLHDVDVESGDGKFQQKADVEVKCTNTILCQGLVQVLKQRSGEAFKDTSIIQRLRSSVEAVAAGEKLDADQLRNAVLAAKIPI